MWGLIFVSPHGCKYGLSLFAALRIVYEFFHIFLRRDENGTRLRAIGGRNVSFRLHAVNQLCCTAVANFQFALEQGGRNALFFDCDTNGICILAVRTLIATTFLTGGNEVTATAALIATLCGKFFELGNELFIMQG